MAARTFRIFSHWLVRGQRLDVRQPADSLVTALGCIGCEGGDGYRLLVYFTDAEPLPAGTSDEEARLSTMYLPLSHWPDVVDLLRNGPMLCAYVDSSAPQRNALQTVDTVAPEGIVRA